MSWQDLHAQYQVAAARWQDRQQQSQRQRETRETYRLWAHHALQRVVEELAEVLGSRSKTRLGAAGFDYEVSPARWMSLAEGTAPLISTALQCDQCVVYIYGQVCAGQPPALFFLRAGQRRNAGLVCTPAARLSGGPDVATQLWSWDNEASVLSVDAIAYRAVTLLFEQFARSTSVSGVQAVSSPNAPSLAAHTFLSAVRS